MNDDQLRAAVASWIDADPHAGDRAELETLVAAGAWSELRARFAGPLVFGTAGLRGPLRAGPNGMNAAVVRRTSAGVAQWMLANGHGEVVVGYDARLRSQEFAHDSAAVFAAAGVRVHLADRPWPTPITAFAVRHLSAGAGVQVTASHNPATDNGYKVYDDTGAQIVAPDDATIAAAIEARAGATIETRPVTAALGDAILAAYRGVALGVLESSTRRDLRIVYTPLCGVGGEVMMALFAAAGFVDVHVVAEEFAPDPGFAGLAFPNPEEPGVLDRALRLAGQVDADIVIVNDPDADRLAVCVTDPAGRWRALSGDELGLWLGALRLDATTERRDRVVARSRVSATALDRLATRLGVECVVTGTGFKWLSRAVDGRSGSSLVFAYEEALGYAVSDAVRDKDGLTAALVAAEGAASTPPLEVLAEIGAHDGVTVTTQWAPRFEGPDSADRMRTVMSDLGEGDPVDVVFAEGMAHVRPSGTEPKLKCYFETTVPLHGASVEAYELARSVGLERGRTMQAELAARLGL